MLTVDSPDQPKELTAEQQQYKDELAEDIARLHPRIAEAKLRLMNAKEESSEAKEHLDGLLADLSNLARDMSECLDGHFQPRLPFGQSEPSTNGEPLVDEGGKLPVDALVEFGITNNMAEKLVEHDIDTVCQLEEFIRTDEWWHQKVKGFGQKKVDQVIDAIVKFREKWPVPAPGDAEEVEVDPAKLNGTAETVTETIPIDPKRDL